MKDFPCGEIKEEKGIQVRGARIVFVRSEIILLTEDGGNALRPG